MNTIKKLLTVEELAEQLNVPLSWVYTRTRLKQIPFVKLGRYVRFDPEKINEWKKKRENNVS